MRTEKVPYLCFNKGNVIKPPQKYIKEYYVCLIKKKINFNYINSIFYFLPKIIVKLDITY